MRRAFTLMEVLIVIALIGIVTAMVTMDFGTMLDNASKPSAVENLRAALDAGRVRASGSGTSVRLYYDNADSVLKLSGDPALVFPLPNVTSVSLDLADDDTGMVRSLDAVVFHPSGYTTPARIRLSGNSGDTEYKVEPFSASISEVLP